VWTFARLLVPERTKSRGTFCRGTGAGVEGAEDGGGRAAVFDGVFGIEDGSGEGFEGEGAVLGIFEFVDEFDVVLDVWLGDPEEDFADRGFEGAGEVEGGAGGEFEEAFEAEGVEVGQIAKWQIANRK
jgi:hypothetical protein